MKNAILALVICVLTSCGSSPNNNPVNNNPVIETRLRSKVGEETMYVSDSDGQEYTLDYTPHSFFDRIRNTSRIHIQFDEQWKSGLGGYKIVQVDDNFFEGSSTPAQQQSRNKRSPSTESSEEYTVGQPIPKQSSNQGRSTQSNSITINGNSSNSFSMWQHMDNYGSVSFQESDGRQHAVIKNAQGQLIFDGDVTTESQRAAMPPNALKILEHAEREQD